MDLKLINSITLGTSPVNSIWLGGIKVWPTGNVTSAMTSVSLSYSSGSAINAAGSNYAYISGTITWYTDGVQTDTSTVVMTPILAGGDSSIWSVNGTQIKAANRGTVTGSTRTASFRATYGSYNSGTFTVTQAANSISFAGGAITSFTIEDESGTITVNHEEQIMYVSSLSGYRIANYSSGAQQHTSASFAIMSSEDWVTVNGTSYITVQEYPDGEEYDYEPREASIMAFDSMFPSVRSTITIVQNSEEYSLTVPTGITIEFSDTYFSFDVYSYYRGNAFAITNQMVSIGSNSSNVRLGTISSMGGGRYRLSFYCNANSVTSPRYSFITISQPSGETATCRVTQKAYSSAIEGVETIAEDGQWVLGTVRTESGYTNGSIYYKDSLVVVRKQEYDYDSYVRIDGLEWSIKKLTPGSIRETYQEDVSFPVEQGSTITLTPLGGLPHIYYGAYVQTDSYPSGLSNMPNLQVTAENFEVEDA